MNFSCKEFTFPASKHYDDQTLTCVTHYEGLDILEEDKAQLKAGTLKLDGECKLKTSN